MLLDPYNIISLAVINKKYSCRVPVLLIWIALLVPKNILFDISLQLLATDED